MGRPAVPFEEKYIPVTESGCWLWTSAWEKKGYGQATNNKRAHRLSWEIHFGDIPSGMRVCHKCDTPACVNPGHLFLGTDLDNVRDKVRKGRHSYGERNGLAKIDSLAAVSICNDPRDASAVAMDHGISVSLVHHVRKGRVWGHATGRSL